MQDFTRLVLCDYRSERVDVRVTADYVRGVLSISGSDVGPLVEETWDDLDYEYWYSFDKEASARLISAIHGEDDPKAALLREFGGEAGCRRLREVCRKNGIEYSFFSYA